MIALRYIAILPLTLLMTAGLALPQMGFAAPQANIAIARAAKLEILTKARQIRDQNSSRISEIQKRKNEIIEQSPPAKLEADIAEIRTALKQHLDRQRFWDRMIFEIDSHFNGGDLREFLKTRLMEMAKVEATSQSSENLMKLFRYTADIIKDLPERKNDFLSIIDGYVRSNNPENPDEPQTFLQQRDYTNGTTSESAQTVSKEEVGDIVEERLEEIKKFEAKTN